jgi:hypothetical protein
MEWLEDIHDTINPTDIKSFYTALWGDSPF